MHKGVIKMKSISDIDKNFKANTDFSDNLNVKMKMYKVADSKCTILASCF